MADSHPWGVLLEIEQQATRTDRYGLLERQGTPSAEMLEFGGGVRKTCDRD